MGISTPFSSYKFEIQFGDLNEDRNSDHVGSEEELLEYIDSVTTVSFWQMVRYRS